MAFRDVIDLMPSNQGVQLCMGGVGETGHLSREERTNVRTYQLNPQLVVNLLAQQHCLGVEVGQDGQSQGFGLVAQVRPLGFAP